MSPTRAREREGLLYGLAAYGLWGLVALYFKALVRVPPGEVLAHRVVWSVVFLGVLLSLMGRWDEVRACVRSGPAMRRLTATTVLVAINWFTYIYSVSSNQLLQSSLGYFVTPLVSVVLGMVFLGERLRPWQGTAVVLAGAGVLNLVVSAGQFPWLALTLALSFGMYGLLRKQVAADGVVALAVETTLLLPLACLFLGWLAWTQTPSFGMGNRDIDVLLLLSGVVTAVPLVCFGQAARRLRLATLGFLQYLSPTLQFLLAVFAFGEQFSRAQLVSFVFIWAGLLLYSLDAALTSRGPAPCVEAPAP